MGLKWLVEQLLCPLRCHRVLGDLEPCGASIGPCCGQPVLSVWTYAWDPGRTLEQWHKS